MNRIDADSPPAPDAEGLLRLMREQSAGEAAQLRAQTEDRVRRIRVAADLEAQSFRAAARAEGEERGRRQAAKLLVLAEAESHRQLLWAREGVIDQAIACARARLAAFAAMPEAPERLAQLIDEGLAALRPGPARVRLPPAYAPLLDRGVRDRVTAGHSSVTFAADANVPDGVLVETEDGRLCFDNTFAARIRRRKQRLRRLVAAALLSQGEVER